MTQGRLVAIGAACLVVSSCASPQLSGRPAASASLDLHVREPLTYVDSPLGPLTSETVTAGTAPATTGHHLGILETGDDALLARLHLIRTAQRAIYIQTFIWTDDETGRYLMHELIEAAERGVTVKILVDQMWSADDPARVAMAATAHPRLEIRHYNPVANRLRPSWWRSLGAFLTHFHLVNQRMHNKLVIVDDRMAIIGGRNIENAYYDRGDTRNFKDRDVLVIGPIVKEMTDSFTEYWISPRVVPSRALADVGRVIRRGTYQPREELEPHPVHPIFREVDRLASDRAHLQRVLGDRMVRVSRVEFVADPPWKNRSFGLSGGGVTTTRLVELLSQAQETVTIQTPYLVLAKRGVAAVKALRRRHPALDLRISTNSLAATDSMYAYAIADKQKERMVERFGLRVYELKPIPADIRTFWGRYTRAPGRHLCLHAKSYVVDSRVLWIGSFNVDPRSANLNTEAGLIVWDTTVAQAVEESILRDMQPQNSWTVGFRKPVPIISPVRRVIGRVADLVPIVDLWPFRSTRSFELRPGQSSVPFHDERFHDRYVNVGPFPKTTFSRRLRIRLLRVFVGLGGPLI